MGLRFYQLNNSDKILKKSIEIKKQFSYIPIPNIKNDMTTKTFEERHYGFNELF